MLRILSLIALLIFSSAGAAQAASHCAYRPAGATAPSELRRGVNLSRWWEDDQHQALAPGGIKNLRALGFDFVRLPLSPTWLTLDNADRQKEKLAQLRCDIVSLLDAKLTVIVDLHAPGDFQKDLAQHPDQAAARLEVLWRRLQPVLAGLPHDRVFLGLYNEPQIDADAWWRIQGRLVRDLRDFFPRNPFVVTAGPDGGPWNLEIARPYDDANIVYDFHFYQPMLFTHHGADWLASYNPEEKTTRIAYPAQANQQTGVNDPDTKKYMAGKWNRAKLAAFIDKIAGWAKRNGVKIACLEFGVYRPYVDSHSRANWLRDMRELLEKNGIPWALWEYRGNFGLLDRDGKPDEGVVNALGLNHSAAR